MKLLIKILLYPAAALVLMLGVWAMHSRHHKLTPSELVEYAEDRIVVLNGPSRPNSGGTGFELQGPSGRTYTVTNRHVCGLAENGIMSAQSKYTQRTTLLRILEISKDHDLCILEGIPNVTGYKVAATPAHNYEAVYAIGHPHLAPNTYSSGLVRERTPIELLADIKDMKDCVGKLKIREVPVFIFVIQVCIEEVDSISTSMVIYPGNSGSPVFNDDNYVVGVVFAGSNEDHYGFYVPYEYLTQLLANY